MAGAARARQGSTRAHRPGCGATRGTDSTGLLGRGGTALLPAAGNHRQRDSAGHAGLLAGGGIISRLSRGGNRRSLAVLPCPVAGWRGAVPGAGGASQPAGRALQRSTGDLGRAPAVSAACAAGTGHCPDPGVFRPALRADALPDFGIAADRLRPAVSAAGPGADPYRPEQGSTTA
ncbi:hypothetical protein BSF44_56620 [Pseudomonas sp. ACN8]|nr:hypothetical protein BSF44_56620 [Pseudomonas sp. ACN8]